LKKTGDILDFPKAAHTIQNAETKHLLTKYLLSPLWNNINPSNIKHGFMHFQAAGYRFFFL